MSSESSSSQGRKPRYDDDDDLSIKKKTSRSNTTLLVVFGAGGIGLAFFAIVFGIVMIGVIGYFNSTEARVVGSWKGRFVLDGFPSDQIYTFRKDGTFREEAFNLQGVRTNVADGVWRFRTGEIQIDWHDGIFENGVVRWIDKNTMEYRIVDHKDRAQIGINVTFRRQ